ncbi:MAG: ABC transporter ATP-binding protein [Thermoplasmatota archaeon]
MLEAQDARKRYGTIDAVQGVSLQVQEGQIVGLVGNNGAGKTTTIKMLCGLIEPTGGTVRLGGEDPLQPKVRQGLGFLPEDSPLYDDMTPLAYLRFFGRIHGMPKARIDARGAELLRRLRLDEAHWTKAIGQLSKGSARKVALARAMLHDPAVLILDEPRSGLDPATQQVLDDFLLELKDAGKAIVLSAHDLDQVERLCDHILVVHDGQIALEGTLEDLRARAGPTTYTLRADQPFPGTTNHEVQAISWSDAQRRIEDVTQQGGTILDVRADAPRLADVLGLMA